MKLPVVAAVVPAAGMGRRMGSALNKIRLSLLGEPVITHTLRVLTSLPELGPIVLAINPSEREYFCEYLKEQWPHEKRIDLIAGGKERQDSVYQGLRYLKNCPGWPDAGARLVVIHDAARALLTQELLLKAIATGWEYGAVGVAVPVKDTIKQVDPSGFVVATPERSTLWAIQTPQVFDYELILKCYERLMPTGRFFSDDCGMAEACGESVKLVPGSYENFKITTPEDMILAEEIIRRRTDANRSGF